MRGFIEGVLASFENQDLERGVACCQATRDNASCTAASSKNDIKLDVSNLYLQLLLSLRPTRDIVCHEP